MNKTKKIVLLTVAILTFALPCYAFDFGGGIRILQVFEDLNLSAEQKSEAARTIKAHRKAVRDGFDQVRSARQALFSSIHQDNYSEQEVRAASKAVSAAEEQFAIERAKLIAELRQVLNAEQKEILENVREEVKDKIDSKISSISGLVDRWLDRHADSVE